MCFFFIVFFLSLSLLPLLFLKPPLLRKPKQNPKRKEGMKKMLLFCLNVEERKEKERKEEGPSLKALVLFCFGTADSTAPVTTPRNYYKLSLSLSLSLYFVSVLIVHCSICIKALGLFYGGILKKIYIYWSLRIFFLGIYFCCYIFLSLLLFSLIFSFRLNGKHF